MLLLEEDDRKYNKIGMDQIGESIIVIYVTSLLLLSNCLIVISYDMSDMFGFYFGLFI